MSNINEIVDVAIEIESPAISSDSFSNLLLIVSEPTQAASYVMPDVARITSEKDLLDYGYSVEDDAYIAAGVAFAQNPGPSQVYVAARKTVDTGEVDEEDQPIYADEPIEELLNRAAASESWYGIAFAENPSDFEIQEIANWADRNSKLYGFTWSGDEIPFDISANEHVFAMYDSTESNQHSEIAWMAKCFTFQPGSETWALKTLNGITASALANAKISELREIPSNYYHRVATRNITQEGKVGTGEWIDIIRMRDWLVNEIQLREYSYMTSNPKVPFNDDGITGIQNVLEGVLQEAQDFGGIDRDRYNEDDELEPGYIVIVPRASSVSKSDRKLRKLTGVKFEARLAGAIHLVVIRGSLIY